MSYIRSETRAPESRLESFAGLVTRVTYTTLRVTKFMYFSFFFEDLYDPRRTTVLA